MTCKKISDHDWHYYDAHGYYICRKCSECYNPTPHHKAKMNSKHDWQLRNMESYVERPLWYCTKCTIEGDYIETMNQYSMCGGKKVTEQPIKHGTLVWYHGAAHENGWAVTRGSAEHSGKYYLRMLVKEGAPTEYWDDGVDIPSVDRKDFTLAPLRTKPEPLEEGYYHWSTFPYTYSYQVGLWYQYDATTNVWVKPSASQTPPYERHEKLRKFADFNVRNSEC